MDAWSHGRIGMRMSHAACRMRMGMARMGRMAWPHGHGMVMVLMDRMGGMDRMVMVSWTA